MEAGGYLRTTAAQDMKLLFEWANDPVTRQQSFSRTQITWEEHQAWFERMRDNPDSRQYMLMIHGEKNEAQDDPVGTLRLEKDGQHSGTYRISYSIAPQYRGMGYGTELLALACRWAAALPKDARKLSGEVKTGNAASLRCFEKNGFVSAKKEGGERQSVSFIKELRRDNLIYMRADANAKVGYGHLMRCLTVADACKGLGMQPVFVTADEDGAGIAEKRGFPCVILRTDYRYMDGELKLLYEYLVPKSTVVLDSYYLTGDYVKELGAKGFHTVWMDDFGKEEYPAGLRINYNLYARDASQEPSPQAAEAEGNTCLAGPRYAPVRPQFCAQKLRMTETVRTILVTTGASDPCGAGAFFAAQMAELFPDAQILAVCGPYVSDQAELRRLEDENPKIRVLTGVSDLSSVMHRSDLAVAAAGSTLYELCAAGVPAVTYYFAENQRQGAEAFARLSGSVCLGDLRTSGWREAAGKRLRENMRRLSDAGEREKLARCMHELVDGKGADRIARKLAKLVFHE